MTASKKSRKKQSKFEKLWTRVASRKAENERFKVDFEKVFQRVQQVVTPAEQDSARSSRPLLHNLFTLAQRKSLANWQREVLDQWIGEILSNLFSYGLVDPETLDCIARYDAFRLDITLEDDSIAPPAEQLIEILGRQKAEYEEAATQRRETQDQVRAERKNQARALAEQQVEVLLDKQLGQAPKASDADTNTNATDDFLQDELEQETKRRHTEYHQERDRLREVLLQEMYAQIDQRFEDEASEDDLADDSIDDLFGFPDYDDEDEWENDNVAPALAHVPKITNLVFQRMFRATAAKLHPDREANPELRDEKQILMSALLQARKKGDVMTVLGMYQQYVGGEETFSKTDEKQLITALEHQITELENEKLAIIEQSPIHHWIHSEFYSASKKRVDKSITEHLRQIKRDNSEIDQMAQSIKTLKTLKPWLEKRYEDEMSMFSFDPLDMDFEDDMPFRW